MDIIPFSERLRQGLEMRNMKPVDLCSKTGISKSRISQYLKGNFKAKQDSLYLLAKALDVSEAWLMGYDVSHERKSESQIFSMELTIHEKQVVESYREHPEMQQAVDKLLGV